MALMSKSQQVERYVRKQIAVGKFNPGERLPSDRELTSKFGVSLMTVREALIKLSKDGLIERKQGAGTFVAERVKKANIGILANVNHITSFNGYFYRAVIEESKRHIEAAGMTPVLFTAHNQTKETLPSDIHLFDKGVVEQFAGVISLINLSKIEPRLNQEGIPAVSLPHPFSKHAVMHDYKAMTEQGVALLRDHGYRNIAVMHFDYGQIEYDSKVLGRVASVLDDVRQNYQVKLAGVPATLSCEHAYSVFKRLWEGPDRPQAVFFHDDAICDMATRAILELGIKVPDELAILTMSNTGRKLPFPVPLTTISFDVSQSLETAWTMLSRLISGKDVPIAKTHISPVIQEGLSLGNRGVVA